MKKVIIRTFTILALLTLTVHIFCIILANVNLKHNTKVWNDLNYTGLIYTQHDYENLKYGLGNIDKNGCGAIAVYNILVLEGKYKPFPEIISFFDNNRENFFGVLGTNPFGIIEFLKNEGFDAKMHTKRDKFADAAKNCKYAILMYFDLKAGHFHLLTDFNGKYCKGLNTTGTFIFEDLVERTKDKITCLIAVN